MKTLKLAITLIAMLVTATAFSASALAYSVSGNVYYSGSKSGRIYLYLEGTNNLGTSVASAGSAYTINGVSNGTYTLYAFMDTIGNGMRHASDPVGMLGSVTVSGGNITSRNITLSDPSTVTPVTPDWVQAKPADKAAFVMWDGPQNQEGVQIADYYVVEYSINSDFSGSTTRTVPANEDNFLIISGLTNGQTYYFRVAAKVGSTTGSPASASGGVTINTPAGGYTVTVPVTLSGFSSPGPLYLAIMDDDGNMFFNKIASPANGTNNYTVPGVQNGTYQVNMFIDMNNNGILDPGDVTNNGEDTLITVNGGTVTSAGVTLTAADSFASVKTSHFMSGEYEGYNLNFEIAGGLKQPVSVTLTDGPSVNTYPVDAASSEEGNYFNFWISTSTRPSTADIYTFTINYSDGTTDSNVHAQVTGVLDSFPTPLSPIGTIGGPGSTTPTFAWLPPSSPPSGEYNYTLWLSSGNDNIWNVDSMPGTQTQAAYNFDQEAKQAALDVDTTYYWSVGVKDSYGNRAESQSSFTVGTSTISFTGTVLNSNDQPISGAAVTLDLEGYSISTTTDDYGSFTLSGLPSGSPFVLKVTKTGYQPTYSQYIIATGDIGNASPFKLFTSTELQNGWGVSSGKGAIVAIVMDNNGFTGGAVVSATSAASGSYDVTYFNGSTFGGTSTYASNGLAFVMNTNDGDSVLLQASKTGLDFDYAIVPTHADSVTETLLYGSQVQPQQNTLSVTVNGSGSVYSDPAGISCDSGTCSSQFDTGSSVTLTAAPGTGSIFSGWSGACTNSSGDCTVTMDGDKSVTALFETTPPVRVEGGDYFNTLQLAFDSATNSSFTVLAQDTELTGNLTAQYNNTVIFKGGYDSSLTQKINGGFTTLTGILTLATGSVTVNELIIK